MGPLLLTRVPPASRFVGQEAETEQTPHWQSVSHVPAQDQSPGTLALPALIGQGRTWSWSEDGSDPPKVHCILSG